MNEEALGIDPGLNNWLTCVSTTGKSFIIDGCKIKAQNQWYNKQVAQIKNGKPENYWDEKLAAITERRNRQMRDNINKAARFVVNWCLNNNISTVVFGWNQGNKDGINIGKQNNQNFVQIPTSRLKERLRELCGQVGIEFVEVEESYTSKASYLDNDVLPTFGEKPEGWKPTRFAHASQTGRRVKRGLYKASNGQIINADCNGAANILRKVASQLGISLVKVCRAGLKLPKRYWLDSLTQSYRKRGEARLDDRVTTSA